MDVSLLTLCRTVCTLGDRYRDHGLTSLVLADRHTVVVEYMEDTRFQFEFLLDTEVVIERTVRKFEDYVGKRRGVS